MAMSRWRSPLVLLPIIIIAQVLFFLWQPWLSSPLASSDPSLSQVLWRPEHETNKRGNGILLFAYGEENETVRYYLGMVYANALEIRQHNPSISIAVVTSHPGLLPEVGDASVFSHIIAVRRDLLFTGKTASWNANRRQWLTRIVYLIHTPFRVTFTFDADSKCCGSFQAMFDRMRATSIDFAFGASGFDTNHPWPTGGALLYRWTPATKLLLSNWIMEQLFAGVAEDDQGPLWKAIGYTPLRGGLLDPTLSFRLMPARGEDWLSPYSHSHVLHRRVIVSHTGWCGTVNDQPDRPRIAIASPEHSLPYNITVVYSPQDCVKVLGDRCNHDILSRQWSRATSLIEEVSFLRR